MYDGLKKYSQVSVFELSGKIPLSYEVWSTLIKIKAHLEGYILEQVEVFAKNDKRKSQENKKADVYADMLFLTTWCFVQF